MTGHKTTGIVLKHYFQPGREAFRQALNAPLPKLLTNGHQEAKTEVKGQKSEVQTPPKDEIQEIAKEMMAKTWKRDQARIAELLKKI